MKTTLWVIGLLILLAGCKPKEPEPVSTEINITTVNELRKPISSVGIAIGGSMGDYFSGTRKDTTFVPTNQLYTDSKGFAHYKVICSPKWAVFISFLSPFDSNGPIYDLVKLEGTMYGSDVRVGEVNNVIVTMKKR